MLKAPQKTCKTFYDYSRVEMSNNICSSTTGRKSDT